MRPKSEIFTPKRDDELPRLFYMRSPHPPGVLLFKKSKLKTYNWFSTHKIILKIFLTDFANCSLDFPKKIILIYIKESGAGVRGCVTTLYSSLLSVYIDNDICL